MMMAVIAVIKYFRLLLAHQHIHLILLLRLLLLPLIRAKQEAGARGETLAAAATLSKHWRMHVVLMSLPKLTPFPSHLPSSLR